MITCKITLPDSPHPIPISKNPRFRALYLARWKAFRFFRLINTIFFIFGCWLLSKKFSFCPKNNGFVRVRGCSPLSPQLPWLILLWSELRFMYKHTAKPSVHWHCQLGDIWPAITSASKLLGMAVNGSGWDIMCVWRVSARLVRMIRLVMIENHQDNCCLFFLFLCFLGRCSSKKPPVLSNQIRLKLSLIS